MSTIIEHGESILFIGDSITDGDRRDDRYRPLGRGYVRFFHDMLVARDSEKSISVINHGFGGNTVEDLRSRWEDDVIAFTPDWLVVAIGINDINQFLCKQGPVSLDPKTFEEIYDGLLDLTSSRLPGTRMVLMEPFYGSRDATPGSYRARVAGLLPEYLEAVARLAAKHGARHLGLNSLFASKLKVQHPSRYFPLEPVHPESAGHFLIAESLYEALSLSSDGPECRP